MAIEKTPRLGLSKYTSGSDLHPNRTEFNALQDLMESLTAISVQGTLAQRPAAGTRNRIYWATDTSRLYFDDGTQWLDVNPNGGGGAGTNVVVAGTASEGTSARAARSDHTHNLPLATSSAHGAMNRTDKAKLDAATGAATALTLAMRNESGQIMVGTPTSNAHAATKQYVDTGLGKKSDTGHTHAGEDITSGTVPAARLPLVTQSVQGVMSAADKTKLDNASASANANALVQRNGSGQIAVGTPTSATHAVTKGYVDDLAALRLEFKGDLGTGTINGTTARGIYTQAQAGPVTTANGYPQDGAAGTLTVLPFAAAANTGYIFQRWTEWLTQRSWQRSTNDGGTTWKAWTEYASTAAATKTANGLMSAADKTKLDNATSGTTGGTLVMRADNGQFQVPNPTAETHAVNKRYTDTELAKKSNTGHTHTLADVTTTALLDSDNLDNIKTSGFYHQNQNAKAVAANNYPALYAGMLEVRYVDANFIYQRYTTYKGNDRFFWRAWYNGAWGPWQEATKEGHKHNGADITSGTIDPARIANATASLDGLMPKADKSKLDAATHLPTLGALAVRHSTAGTIQALTGTGVNDLTNKGYVDGELAKKAALSHKHTVADLTAGNLTMTHLRLTNTTDASETSTGHAFQIGADTGTNLIIDNNEIIGRNNGVLSGIGMPGGINSLPAPTADNHAANKGYVDTQIATRAASSHNHSAANITSGTLAAARLPLATASANGAMSSTDKAKLDAATASGTASTIVMRDANQRITAASPSGTSHVATKGYVDSLTQQVRANATIHQFAAMVAGEAKPEGTPWRHFAGWVNRSTGAGGENRTANLATDAEGIGGIWLGYDGVPNFSGICYVSVQNRATATTFASSVALVDITLTRIKFQARRLSNSNWANGYGNFISYVEIWGW